MATSDSTCRIYAASLSDYNDGRLHGVWIDLDSDTTVEDIEDQISAMLKASPFARSEFAQRYGMLAEEWAIHDYEGFGGIRLHESESLDRIVAIVDGIGRFGNAYLAWVLDTGEIDTGTFEDEYQGEYNDEFDYGYQWFESMWGFDHEPLDRLESYVDWQAYGEALLSDQSHAFYQGRLYVFGG
jgi:antirestriction protein